MIRKFVERRALRQVNKVRAHWGAEPLTNLRPGFPGQSSSCPIYNSLQDASGNTLRYVKAKGIRTNNTLIVAPSIWFFVMLFDQGGYPDLDCELLKIRESNQPKEVSCPTSE